MKRPAPAPWRRFRFNLALAGQLRDAFREIDSDNNGSICVDELKMVVKKEGEPRTTQLPVCVPNGERRDVSVMFWSEGERVKRVARVLLYERNFEAGRAGAHKSCLTTDLNLLVLPCCTHRAEHRA